MTSMPLAGSRPSSNGNQALPSIPPDDLAKLPPDALAAYLMAKKLEEKKLEWASWAEHQFTRCMNARVNFERQWYINLAFIAGKQYAVPMEVSAVGFRLAVPKGPPHRVRLVINKIRAAVRTECSKLTTSKPIPTVLPATNEDEDFSAAAVGEQILKSGFATAEFESKYRSWVWWGVACGNSWLKQYYDPKQLDFDSKSMPEPPTFPEEMGGQPIPPEIIASVPGLDAFLQTPQPAMGKICVDVVTPFHILAPDLLTEGMEEQPYVIHVMTKSPEWIKKTYGFDASPDTRASNTVLDAATIISKNADAHLDAAYVKEVWIKPYGHKDFPDGGLLTIINHKCVAISEKWPYSFPEYPFYKYNGVPTGGFYSDSNVVDLIPLQKEYNKKRSQMIEIANTMGKPHIIYAKGSLNPKKISSEPGSSIEYVAGYPEPILAPGVEVPASFVSELQQLTDEFDDISGQHEISRGSTDQSNITSGTAIAYLQEQDDAKLNYPVASIENACELLGKHRLHLIAEYWDDNRLVHITGKNNTFEAMHWKKGMLRGNTDVKVQTGSALPFSKAAKQAMITEMMTNGFIDPQSGLEILNMGGLDKMLDDLLIDKRQAIRENLKMADLPDQMVAMLLQPAPGPNGEPPYMQPTMAPGEPVAQEPKIIDGKPYEQPPVEGPPVPGMPQQMNGDGTPFQPRPPIPVNSWDNNEEHIRWHNHFRKTQEFELLSDVKKQAFELHVQLHQQATMAPMGNMQGQLLQPGMVQEPVPGEEGTAPEQQASTQPTGGVPAPPTY